MADELTSASPLAPLITTTPPRAQFSVRPAPLRALPEIDGLLAGAAERDITPPPGLPKAGYSSNAHDGHGFRTRLRARVVHLRSGRVSLALVQCDLLGGSSVLQHLVARAISARTDIPLAGLMIGATHTHAGPGQFLGTDFYNRFASNRGGFDPAWTEFLVDRITDAVVEAHDSRSPAVAAFGEVDVWGLTRNRSLVPHVQNESVIDKRTEAQRKFVSVNPRLDLLRVDALGDDDRRRPLAATVIFSVHGTGVSMRSREYNADLWAYLCGELSHRITRHGGSSAVVGAIEGTHADVAPAIRPGMAGHVEAQRIGRAVGSEAFDLWTALEDRLSSTIDLGVGLREVDLATDRNIDGTTLPKRPAVGAALIAGAAENVTPILWRIPPFRAGSPRRLGRRGPQAEKWVIGSRFLQPVLLALRSFPRVLPIQVLRIGDVAIVGLPFEVTVESGRRIADAVMSAVSDAGLDRVVVSSVANEYSGYVTTAAEYSRQYYEGGHTLYGPRTQPFLGAHAARLAAEVVRHGSISSVAAVRRWDLRAHRYLARPTGVEISREIIGRPLFVDVTAATDGYWELRWQDVAPGDLAWHEPLVRVESCDGADGRWQPAERQGRVVDDQGWDLEVIHLGQSDPGHPGAHDYAVRWHDPDLRAGRSHRFVLVANNGRPAVVSDPFD